MKKVFFTLLVFCTVFSAYAKLRQVSNTCMSISLGFVTIWTGSKTFIDDATGVITTESCGVGGGRFDWFWE